MAMASVLLSLILCNSEIRSQALLRTFHAIAFVESSGDPKAYNRAEDAAGIAQIRPIMLADCNRIMGYDRWTLADRFNPVKSLAMFLVYSRYYAPNGTPETWARNWCAGPKGHTKSCSIPYWNRVKKVLDDNTSGRCAFRGSCPLGMEAIHLDNNPQNNHLENLKWGTHSENQTQYGTSPWIGAFRASARFFCATSRGSP